MSKNSSLTKTNHLGVSYGTAMNRLRKLIIFDLLQRLGEDVCFKCGQKIASADELSIDHKIPWLHGDEALFWSLDNIAFSHRRCNKPDRYVGKKPKAAPPGQAWCVGCKQFRDGETFWKNKATWNGLQKQCRDCCLDRTAR